MTRRSRYRDCWLKIAKGAMLSAVPAWPTLAARLSEQHGLPVVDGVASAIKLGGSPGRAGS